MGERPNRACAEAYWLLREWRRAVYGDFGDLRSTLDDVRAQILASSEPVLKSVSCGVSVRTKGLWSAFHKASVRGKMVHDVLALRVVIRGDSEDLYDALEAVRNLWPSTPSAYGRFKDYVAHPKANGYKALHDTLLLPNGAAMEVQFRTEDSHREAEYGAAAHGRYKGALCHLPLAVLRGVATSSFSPSRSRREARSWPLPAEPALTMAARMAHAPKMRMNRA